ncbi:MAG: hypothetical protein JSR82_06820 [Verrucomicrobia bacterium]|nr:hypothetical protein [Verrucomicrobiota bacterium]
MPSFPPHPVLARLAAPLALATVAGLGWSLLPAAAPGDAVPVTQPISRYQKIIDDSPFRKPTEAAPVATPPPKQPGFAEDLFVGGVMTLGDKNVVQIVQRSDSQRFAIATGEDNPQGLTLVNIQYGDGFQQTRVTVKKGNEFGVLMFDQNAVASRPAAPVRLPGPGAAPTPNALPPGVRPNNGFTPPSGNRPGPGPTPPPSIVQQQQQLQQQQLLQQQMQQQQGIPGLPVPGGTSNGAAEPPRGRPRPLIKADPNAQPTPPPAQRVLPGRAEVQD